MSLDAISVILVTQNAAHRISKIVADWLQFLSTCGRDYQLIVVDDGSSDGTWETLEQNHKSHPRVMLLRHSQFQGFGACLRTALPHCSLPLLFYTSTEYPYTPGDLKKLLSVIGTEREYLGIKFQVAAVNGLRNGLATPAFWRYFGLTYRIVCRVLMGHSLEKLPTWLGFRAHLRSWIYWLLLGVPLVDPESAFKLFRRSLLDRFPLQSDGDFVHVEIFAKLTFLTTMVAEEKLTPREVRIPACGWSDFMRVLRDSQFHPALPDLSTPSLADAPTSSAVEAVAPVAAPSSST